MNSGVGFLTRCGYGFWPYLMISQYWLKHCIDINNWPLHGSIRITFSFRFLISFAATLVFVHGSDLRFLFEMNQWWAYYGLDRYMIDNAVTDASLESLNYFSRENKLTPQYIYWTYFCMLKVWYSYVYATVLIPGESYCPWYCICIR